MVDVFISYVEEDGAVAAELAAGLEAAGYQCWYYERDSLPGLYYTRQVLEVLNEVPVVVVILSPAAIASHQVDKELVWAHEAGRTFVPLLRGLTHPEFRERRPDWAMLLGATVAVAVPASGAAAIVPRLVRGLHQLGIESGTAATVVAASGAAVATVATSEPGAITTGATPLAARRWRLPAPPTPLVGRERELQEVFTRLQEPHLRLLTLLGPGGVGKTRLALAVAERMQDHLPEGAVFVPLAPLTDQALVPSAIADALGVREAGTTSLTDAIFTFLADKHLLLVLDNVEHVVDGAAPLVGDLLATCPELRILATSRVPLRLRSEQEYAVLPLPLPRRKPPPTVEQLSQFEAVQLFIDRARAVQPSFEVTDENAPAVAEICHRLDGLPLAIELAAARIRLLSPQAMLGRLEHVLPLLTGGARDAPARQRTLRQTIAWSYDLLAPDEQTLFRRLAVFAGGCSVAAAEAIANPDGTLDLFGGLERLVEHNLLRQVDGAVNEPRVQMLETIREFGVEQLAGEAEAIRHGHAAYFLALAEEGWEVSNSSAPGPAYEATQAQFEADYNNLRAVLAFALERHDAELALRLAAPLSLFWVPRGHLGEGRQWLEQALELDGGSTAARAWALFELAGIVWSKLEYARSEALLQGSLGLFRDLGDELGISRATAYLAGLALEQGDFERALTLGEEALRIAHALDHHAGIFYCQALLASTLTELGEFNRARTLLDEAYGLAEQSSDRTGAAHVLLELGRLALRQDDVAQAVGWCRQSLVRWRGSSDLWGTLSAIDCLALGLRAGQPEPAVELLAGVTSLREANGTVPAPMDRDRQLRVRDELRTTLGEPAFTAAWTTGAGLTLEEAVAKALEVTGSGDSQ